MPLGLPTMCRLQSSECQQCKGSFARRQRRQGTSRLYLHHPLALSCSYFIIVTSVSIPSRKRLCMIISSHWEGDKGLEQFKKNSRRLILPLSVIYLIVIPSELLMMPEYWPKSSLTTPLMIISQFNWLNAPAVDLILQLKQAERKEDDKYNVTTAQCEGMVEIRGCDEQEDSTSTIPEHKSIETFGTEWVNYLSKI